jgi:hypothetical protein
MEVAMFWNKSIHRKLDTIIDNQKILLSNQRRLLWYMCQRFDRLDADVHKLLLRLGPGAVKILATGEKNMAITFKVQLPAKSAADVVARELTVKIGDSEPIFTELAADAAEVDELQGPEGAEVEVSLVDIDDAGNRSEPSVATAVLADTFAPPKPGELGIQLTGEIDG